MDRYSKIFSFSVSGSASISLILDGYRNNVLHKFGRLFIFRRFALPGRAPSHTNISLNHIRASHSQAKDRLRRNIGMLEVSHLLKKRSLNKSITEKKI
jgi:hypothetical protein